MNSPATDRRMCAVALQLLMQAASELKLTAPATE
jgi:hypothetical protein